MSSNVIYTSPLCSCIICKEIKSAKGIHSHYLAKHTEAGQARVKHNGSIGQEKSRKTHESSKQKRVNDYSINPSKCKFCNVSLSYNERNNKFCSHVCAASWNNKHRLLSGWKLSKESKQRISESIKNKPHPQRVCLVSFCSCCGKLIRNSNNKTCSKLCFAADARKRSLINNLGANGQRSGKIQKRIDSYGNKVRLESSYETKLADILDRLNIRWSRPTFLRYTDTNGISHRYFPDFLLNDLQIFLDPKNKYLIEKDREKIKSVIEQNNVPILIIPGEFLTSDLISLLLSGLESNQFLGIFSPPHRPLMQPLNNNDAQTN